MQDFTLFLLKNWLPVGVASITFFVIGLFVAKLIWGRWSQRLAFAVEENLNLASQWNALGSSQRDLFKKLRARWQADRDVWETRLVEADAIVAQKDARINQLAGQLASSGKEVPEEVQLDSGLLAEIESLKSEIREKEKENRALKAESAAPVQPLALVTPAKEGKSSSELETRIADLEKDLIDTHDELHQVRADYLKQVELVEVLETRITSESTVEATPHGDAKMNQLSVLLAQRSGDLVSFRAEVKALRQRNLELQAELAEAQKAEGLTVGLEQSAAELAKVQLALKTSEVKLADRDSDISRLRVKIESKESQLEALNETLAAKGADIEMLEGKLVEAEILEQRRVMLQADLNDSNHEMYDVRRALNDRLDEIEMLEARLDELDPIEQAHAEMVMELKDTRHELSDVRLAYNEKVSELEQQTAQMEELEAIIEDRGAEVNDLSEELRQKRDELRLLKNTLAETEGELEAITDEAKTFTTTLNGKELFLQEQATRIMDLESALTERYTELNAVRTEFDSRSKDSKYHESRADQLAQELQRREKEFLESDARVASAEEAMELAKEQIQELTSRLADSEKSIEDLQSSLQDLSREKEETIRELELATKRVAELEEATREREEHITTIEQEWRDGSRHAESLERQIGKLNVEVEEARESRQHTQVAIEELEEALKASDDRVLKVSGEIEEKDAELSRVKSELEELHLKMNEREEEISTLRNEASALQAELEATQEAGSADLENVRLGFESEFNAEVERLKVELSDKEDELRKAVGNRSDTIDEISQLERKVEKRGEAIRDLQNEVSHIMMQRTARDNEVAALKDKLREVERELSKARELSSSSALASTPPSVRDLEEALKLSLAAEESKSAGRSLDQLDHVEEESAPNRTKRTEAHHANVEPEDEDNVVFFDEAAISLTEKTIAKIDEFARQVRRSNKVTVSVIGFAGPEGSADLTESLSARRADAVRERLLERGVPQSKIEVKSSGQDRKFTNWRARRVELIAVPVAVAESVN